VSARLGGGAVVQAFPPQINGGSGRLGAGRRVAADWWLAGGVDPADVVAAYQPIGAASLAASYVNLASPGTFDAAPGVAPGFDVAIGWLFTGSQWLNTFYDANQQNTITMIAFSGATDANNYLFGWINAAPGQRYAIIPRLSATGVRYRYGSVDDTISPVLISGVLGLGNGFGWKNGVKNTPAATLPSASNRLIIGAVNTGTPASIGAVAPITANISAFWTCTNATDLQIQAVSAAMAALT
jgi:hypothetical protein